MNILCMLGWLHMQGLLKRRVQPLFAAMPENRSPPGAEPTGVGAPMHDGFFRVWLVAACGGILWMELLETCCNECFS